MITLKGDQTNRKISNKQSQDHSININLKIIKGLIKLKKESEIKVKRSSSIRTTNLDFHNENRQGSMSLKAKDEGIMFKNKFKKKLLENDALGKHFIQVHPMFNNVFIDTKTKVIVYLKDHIIA